MYFVYVLSSPLFCVCFIIAPVEYLSPLACVAPTFRVERVFDTSRCPARHWQCDYIQLFSCFKLLPLSVSRRVCVSASKPVALRQALRLSYNILVLLVPFKYRQCHCPISVLWFFFLFFSFFPLTVAELEHKFGEGVIFI